MQQHDHIFHESIMYFVAHIETSLRVTRGTMNILPAGVPAQFTFK